MSDDRARIARLEAALGITDGVATQAGTDAATALSTATTANTNASSASAAASAASTAAAAAGTLASNAQATANGKNTVFYSASTPSANAAGDLWFQTAVQHVPPPSGPLTTVIVAQYKATAAGTGSWVVQPLTSAAFAYIDAGIITTGILSGINIIGTFIETQANVGTGTSPSVVPGVLLNASGQLFCYNNTGPVLVFDGSSLTLPQGATSATGFTATTGSGQPTAQVVASGLGPGLWVGSGSASETAPAKAIIEVASGTGGALEEFVLIAPNFHGNIGGQIALISSQTAGDGGVVFSGDGIYCSSGLPTLTSTAVGFTSGNQFCKVSSSRRYKTGIRALQAPDDVLKIKPRRWRYKAEKDGPDQWGPIAEDVEKVAPELVVHDEKGRPDSVDAGRIAMVQVQALLDRITALEAEVKTLRKKVA